MNAPFTLTLEQLDTIDLSLSKALAVAKVVAECRGEPRHIADDPPPASLYVVMLVIVEELEKIDEIMQLRHRS